MVICDTGTKVTPILRHYSLTNSLVLTVVSQPGHSYSLSGLHASSPPSESSPDEWEIRAHTLTQRPAFSWSIWNLLFSPCYHFQVNIIKCCSTFKINYSKKGCHWVVSNIWNQSSRQGSDVAFSGFLIVLAYSALGPHGAPTTITYRNPICHW